MKEAVKPALFAYLVISAIVFFQIFRDIFIVYFSGTEIMSEAYSLEVSKHWISVLSVLGIIYLLPALCYLPGIKKYVYLVPVLLVVSLIPDICQNCIWNSLLVKGDVQTVNEKTGVERTSTFDQ